jgi:hypothetical protein
VFSSGAAACRNTGPLISTLLHVPTSCYLWCRSRLLKATNTLRVLELRHCEMGPGAMKAMSDGLGAAGSVSKLDLSGNKLGDDGAAAVGV